MGIEDLGLLLENIEEYVMEQKKVVTYKWLSRTFSLNVNQAKQLLAIFHMKHKNMKHKSIQGVYYVSGMRTNSAGHVTHQVCIVTEDLLDATTAQLDPVTGVHLYSVQKGKPKDTAPMYNVDFEQLKKKVFETTEFSMVQCPDAKISQVINNALRPVTPPALKNKVKVMKPTTVTDSKSSVLKTTSKKTTAAKTGTTKKSEPVKKSTAKKQDLANFFGKGKAEPKKNEPKKFEAKKTDPKKLEPKKPEPKMSSPLKACKKKTSPESLAKSKPKVREPLAVDDSLLIPDVEEENDVKEIKTKSKPNPRTTRVTGTKRKRVRKFSDEEEDTLQEEMSGVKLEDEDQGICMSDDNVSESTTENKKSLSKESPECKKQRVRRKRVRKLVSKTTINEEGFMETEKVWEDFSCTDDEDEKEDKKEEKKVEITETKSEAKARNKQSSLMGFFKKS